MLEIFNYPEDVIVLVKYQGVFSWFVSNKELWVMDLVKLQEDFIIKLKEMGKEPEDYVDDEREGLLILNNDNFKEFQGRMKKYQFTYKTLVGFFDIHPEKLYYRNAKEILPDFYIDFDSKTFNSYFDEANFYEYYVPEGWKGIRNLRIDQFILHKARCA